PNEFGFDDQVRTVIFTAVALLINSLHNATRRHQAHLLAAREEALAASRAKDQFLAALSHELRNPLSPVLALASLLERDASLPAATRDDAATIRRNVELEAHLIDDLLDLSRITTGKLPFQLEP